MKFIFIPSKKPRVHFLHFLFATLLLASSHSFADIAVVVNPKSNISQASAEEISRIFLGKRNAINGTEVIPFEHKDDAINQEFYSKVLKKSKQQVRAYWSRTVFTGKGFPPQKLDPKEVQTLIAKDKNAIAYIDSTDVTANMKVIFKLN